MLDDISEKDLDNLIEDMLKIEELDLENKNVIIDTIKQQYDIANCDNDKKKHYKVLNGAISNVIQIRTKVNTGNIKIKNDKDNFKRAHFLEIMDITLDTLQEIISPYMVFNKDLFFKNLRFLLDFRGIKTGTFETDAMVAPGYISRIEKGSFDASPSIEFVIYCSKLLRVSIDTILNIDLTKVVDDEGPLLDLANELRDGTYKDSYQWNMVTDISNVNEVEEFLPKKLSGAEVNNPGEIYSLFSGSLGCINNTMLSTKLKNGLDIYLIPVKDNGDNIEIYIRDNTDEIVPVATTKDLTKGTKALIMDAYLVIQNVANKKRISNRGINMIRDYIESLK